MFSICASCSLVWVWHILGLWNQVDTRHILVDFNEIIENEYFAIIIFELACQVYLKFKIIAVYYFLLFIFAGCIILRICHVHGWLYVCKFVQQNYLCMNMHKWSCCMSNCYIPQSCFFCLNKIKKMAALRHCHI